MIIELTKEEKAILLQAISTGELDTSLIPRITEKIEEGAPINVVIKQ